VRLFRNQAGGDWLCVLVAAKKKIHWQALACCRFGGQCCDADCVVGVGYIGSQGWRQDFCGDLAIKLLM